MVDGFIVDSREISFVLAIPNQCCVDVTNYIM